MESKQGPAYQPGTLPQGPTGVLSWWWTCVKVLLFIWPVFQAPSAAAPVAADPMISPQDQEKVSNCCHVLSPCCSVCWPFLFLSLLWFAAVYASSIGVVNHSDQLADGTSGLCCIMKQFCLLILTYSAFSLCYYCSFYFMCLDCVCVCARLSLSLSLSFSLSLSLSLSLSPSLCAFAPSFSSLSLLKC